MNEPKEKPIIFSDGMVRAILAGKKTQTRRLVKPNWLPGMHDGMACFTTPWTTVWENGVWHTWDSEGVGGENDRAGTVEEAKGQSLKSAFNQGFYKCPHGEAGSHLWVREAWAPSGFERVEYRAFPADGKDFRSVARWKPSIHMPRAFSRITLEIVSVSVERLQEISEVDAVAEGVARQTPEHDGEMKYTFRSGNHIMNGRTARDVYESIWGDINGYDSWALNPWVWKITFNRIKP